MGWIHFFPVPNLICDRSCPASEHLQPRAVFFEEPLGWQWKIRNWVNWPSWVTRWEFCCSFDPLLGGWAAPHLIWRSTCRQTRCTWQKACLKVGTNRVSIRVDNISFCCILLGRFVSVFKNLVLSWHVLFLLKDFIWKDLTCQDCNIIMIFFKSYL